MANHWNPWHGCHKISPGCKHCYVYRSDSRHGKDASIVTKTGSFDLPIRRNRLGAYKICGGEMVWTCFTSDFLLEDADPWRKEAWAMMKERSDLNFFFITKRIERFSQVIPADWGAGYANVAVGCTVENQDRANFRLPLFRDAPIAAKTIICEPILEAIDLDPYLGPWVQEVVVGGESGPEARPCHYQWVLDIQKQCTQNGIGFWFKQTGANFVKDGKTYAIPRKQQHRQAHKAGISRRTE